MSTQVEPVVVEAAELEEQVATVEQPPLVVDKQLVARLVGDAQRQGLSVDGEGGLLAQLTKLVVESALEGELSAHLGYDKHVRTENGGNYRNGTRPKTVLTKAGPIEIEVPRDRAGTFTPVVVAKRQRRLGSIEDIVLSLSARGMTHGDIAAHLADVYGSEVSKTTISTITDKVLDGMAEWQGRPLDPVYPVVFIDCIHVKIRDGQVANRPIYIALAVTVDGNRDILGLWAGDGGEGAKYWQQVLTEIKNRGVEDVLMLVCDGLKHLPESCQRGVAGHDRSDVHRASDEEHLPVRGPAGLGSDHPRPETGVPGRYPRTGRGTLLGVPGDMGRQVPGRDPAVVQRLGRVRAVPPVRPGDPPNRVHHERDRVGQRSHPQSREGPGPLPQRASRPQMRLPGRDGPRPHRQRTSQMDPTLEASPKRIRHHLRRPAQRRPPLTTQQTSYTVNLTVPRASGGAGSESDELPNFLNVLLGWFECGRTAQGENYQRGGYDHGGVPTRILDVSRES